MPRAYSLDLRERLLRANAAGLTAAEIERTTGVTARTLRRWRQRQQQGQSLEPGHAPGRALAIGPDQWDAVRAQIAAHPDATLAEHCDRWAAEQGVRVSTATMCRLLQRLGLPLKKRA
jgi:transposase